MPMDDELDFIFGGTCDGGIVGHFKPDSCSRYFQGHFPGNPLVPGVILLEISLRILVRGLDMPRENLIVDSFRNISFIKPVFPEENVEIRVFIDGCEARCFGFIQEETVFKFVVCFKFM